ncbi:hypothetical protein [Leptothoe kymatousa]|uniref:Uncharacterized protein n=1 Tax=Leptothoe kymatousa TAU-MAC 1615 TaxID=2364775 RepID=A0ABS5Y6H6_9CYAN|nr:hypothetical protein [Leptothoe kymatousa]MBT9312565.1 hypothetical protein [Leptothoe kymatousa TAU-MAC 1615]
MTDRLIPESELKAIVKQILADLLGVNPAQQHQRQWYKASEAAPLVDMDTPNNLHDLRMSGDLIEGKHWRQTNGANSKRPTYQYHVGNCRKFLENKRS